MVQILIHIDVVEELLWVLFHSPTRVTISVIITLFELKNLNIVSACFMSDRVSSKVDLQPVAEVKVKRTAFQMCVVPPGDPSNTSINP